MEVEPPTAPTQPRNNTVYIRNLDESIKIPALIEALTELFEEYGSILEIVAKRNLRAKGQAFVVFETEDAAANAIEEIQGFDLFNKPMHLDFAKTRSDATVKQNGDDAELEAHKRRRTAEKERKQAQEEVEKLQREKLKRPTPVDEGDAKLKQQRTAGLKSTASKGGVVPDEYLPPNKILFVQNIPEDYYDVDALSAIFGRFEGFNEVRLVPTKKTIAFVEYEAEAGAISAKESLAGMALGAESKQIKVTFQRK